jgi:hypothetical protein
MNLNSLISEWQSLKDEIAELSDRERELRQQLTPLILEDKIEGSKTTRLGDYKLCATAVLNYTIDRDELELRRQSLTDEDWTALDFKPVVKPAAFRKLSSDSILHRVVAAKPGMAQLRVVEHYENNDDS